MSQLSVMLQESVQREETRTILGLLRGKMDGVDARRTRWSTLRERLGLKGIGCCGGPNSGFRPTNITVRDDDEEEEQQQQQQQPIEINVVTNLDPNEFCLGLNPDLDPAPVTSGMNLAAALAAERQFRATSNEAEGSANVASSPGTPVRVSLMRLLEETDGGDQAAGVEQLEEKQREEGNDSVCCVCMGRKKGAAFIPCGHTFCRVCSRELWLNRGSCPLCNRSILEILDIF